MNRNELSSFIESCRNVQTVALPYELSGGLGKDGRR